ncbi:MAG: regulatory protein GemA [Myxococcales bacterium]|uniref:regulatory protein GemA n=1 Tax=Sediminibacterium sp. TaxID=1917865 RepID=UPI001D755D05|nr:regulatory protein GemA [Sediminibacterium sp.]MBT9485823.1 regulatory protein GemA [Sediminibacterium sp.]MBT9556846.1 regulatory protein GemA [Myxococcales bacterium]
MSGRTRPGRPLTPRITTKQIAVLHVARKQLGWDEATYRDVLRGIAGVESSKDLTHAMFEAVLEHAKHCGFHLTAPLFQRVAPSAARPAPTPAQLHLLRELFEQLGWDAARQRGFCMRMTKRPWPQTNADAIKVTEALKAMIARGYGDRKAKGAEPPPEAA